MQPKIVVIGCGRLGRQLIGAFIESGTNVIQAYNRTKKRAQKISVEFNIDCVSELSEILRSADFYIVSVSDRAINDVSKELDVHDKAVVVHTSGNAEINLLNKHKNYGWFYPLDTYTDSVKTDFSQCPFLIEGNHTGCKEKIESLAKVLSERIYHIDASRKSYLHLAAVFANNFTNKMLGVSQEILEENNLPPEVLNKLIESTFKKVKTNHPNSVQTGPALRGDLNTLKKHLYLLKDDPDLLAIYRRLSLLINPDLDVKELG